MLRGRTSGDNDEKIDNSPPDRLIHFEPDEGSSESNHENGSVFGTYYKHIASDDSEDSGSKLFGKKTSDNFGNPNKDADTDIIKSSEAVNEESTAVTFQSDDVVEENLSESSFPIFLSFKANDPAKSVSEALREKSNTFNDTTAEVIGSVESNVSETEPADVLSQNVSSEDYIDPLNDPFDIPLDELDVPIFKPIESKPVEEIPVTYDIPQVFEDKSEPIKPTENNASITNASEPLDFPLLDSSEEPKLEFESDPYEGTVLSHVSEEPEDTSNTTNSNKHSDSKSGFSFFSAINDTPFTPDSDAFPLNQNDNSLRVESLPVNEDNHASETVPENLYDDLSEVAPIFAPSPPPLKFMNEEIFDHDANATAVISNEQVIAPEFEPEVVALASTETPEIVAPPIIKTRGSSSRSRNESVAAVLKDDGFAVFKEVNSADNESGKSNVDSNNVLTERPGRNYSSKQVTSTVSPSQKGIQSSINLERSASKYTAAQQMGTVAPLPQRYHKKNRRSAAPYIPIIVLILMIIFFIGLWQAWTYFDLGNVFTNLFNSKSEPKVSTFETPSSASIIASDTSMSSDTSAASESTATPTLTPTPTSSPTPTTKPTETSAETTVETTAETTTETTAITTTETTVMPGVPTKFITKILNGSSDGATAYFDLRFENSGSNDSSLVDSLKQITITYESSQTIEEVTSSFFTFVKKEGSTNVFIGTPISTAVIMQDDFVLADITGVTTGGNVGKFSIKYFIEFYS